ncbi:MAG: hypothetical protein DRQ06_03260 [Candidatus Hydrothermota bacterium]|nr:MAG: hypothetical protein DRQ06_03260 [Candidatus Hydrothermae bacterium]
MRWEGRNLEGVGFFVLCAGFIWMLFGMGCMDKNASTFLLPHFLRVFVLFVLFFSISLAFAMQ